MKMLLTLETAIFSEQQGLEDDEDQIDEIAELVCSCYYVHACYDIRSAIDPTRS